MYDDYLDELLEEAYLEGYYDSIDDYDNYYMERKSTIHPSYLTNPYEDESIKKIRKKLHDTNDFNDYLKYNKAYSKLLDNKEAAYRWRRGKDEGYLRKKGVIYPRTKSNAQLPGRGRPIDFQKYFAKSEKGRANL